jgi:hypothetical protein
MEDEKIHEMIEVISCKHFQKNEEREEFENELWAFTTLLMKMWSDFKEKEPYKPEEIRHG